MKKRKRIAVILSISGIGLVLILIMAGVVTSHYAQTEIKNELVALDITFSSVNINLLTGSVTIENIDWSQLDDSLVTAPHHLTIKTLKASGVNLFKLLASKKLYIHKLSLEEGDFHYNKMLNAKRKEPDLVKKILIKEIFIHTVEFLKIKTTIVNDSIKEFSAKADLLLKDVVVSDIANMDLISSYKVKSFETSITKIYMNEKDGLYILKASELFANSVDQKIIIDSISLIPKFSKYRFSRKVGKQIDRFTLNVPQLSISGFDFTQVKDSVFRMKLIEIDYSDLHVYRDKRLPFIKKKNTPLPIAMIRSFPFEMAIDSIRINDAKITYEEFPEKGFQRGQISFEGLNATIDHVSNRNHYDNYKQSTIKVASRIMGNATINAEFSLPYGKAQIYNAKGVIKNLALHRPNPILESLAFISVESGKLNQLNFNFDYNDFRSDGSVIVNYENLKIISMTKEKESIPNEFKSWVLNTFIKNNKDRKVSLEKRTGIVDFERDRRRAIINLWVKSLFSGLKSSVLDSPNKKKNK